MNTVLKAAQALVVTWCSHQHGPGTLNVLGQSKVNQLQVCRQQQQQLQMMVLLP